MPYSSMNSLLGFVVLGAASVLGAEEVSVSPDLTKATTSKEWVLPPGGEASFRNGQLMLDGLKHMAVPDLLAAVLQEPVLSNFTLTCKVYAEPGEKGTWWRFYVLFGSKDGATYQFVGMNRQGAMLGWSDVNEPWNLKASAGGKWPAAKWIDVKLQCTLSEVRFYLDDKLVLSKSDERWLSNPRWLVGRVGFAANRGSVRVKDIRIKGTRDRLERPWHAATRQGAFHELSPAYRHTDISGKLDITVSEPFTISSHRLRPELGDHRNPHVFKLPCGDVLVIFHQKGSHGATRVMLRSSDKGKTWTPCPVPVNRIEALGSLRDGTVLIYDDYSFRREGNAFVGEMVVSRDGGKTFGPMELAVFNRTPKVATCESVSPTARLGKKTAARWAHPAARFYKNTSAKWSDWCGHALWRSVLEKEDGTLIACAHTAYKLDMFTRSVCYHSIDKGRTWGSESVIAYNPEQKKSESEPKVDGHYGGFTEPVMSFCSNGDVLSLVRESGKPLRQARSTDGGKTWRKPKTLEVRGVDPDLCLMTSGVLACSYGRPGNRVMFSVDGTGKKWTDKLKMYEGRGTTGYTGIAEVEPGKLLFVHDQWKWPDTKEENKVIRGVYITVRRK